MSLPLNSLIDEAIDERLKSLHTALPAEVLSFDASKLMVKVRPFLMRKYKSGETEQMPEVYNVPVVYPRSGQHCFYFPLKKGDKVMLLFSERSLDKWLELGSYTTPDDQRKFDLTDAICVPGLYDFKNPIEFKGANTSLLIQAPGGYIEITEGGDVSIINEGSEFTQSSSGTFKITNGSVELIDILSTLLQSMIEGKNLTAIGPLNKDPDYILALTELKTKLDQLKS